MIQAHLLFGKFGILRRQVAALQRSDISKSDHAALASALVDVSANLVMALKNAESQEDIKEGLKAAALDTVDDWLLKLGQALIDSMVGKLDQRFQALESLMKKVQELLGSLPSVKDEGAYREKAITLVSGLAKQTVSLEHELKGLGLYDQDKRLTFPRDKLPASGLVGRAEECVAVASCHVTFVAAR